MKIARTWRNLAVALLVLPWRAPVMLLLLGLVLLGRAAERVGRWLGDVLPELAPDPSAVQRANAASHAQIIGGYTKLCQKGRSGPPEPRQPLVAPSAE